MSFAWPHLLWCLALPAAFFAADFARRRRAAAASHPKIQRAEASAHGLSFVERPSTPHRARPWLMAGIMLAVVALARPQWGRIEKPVFDQAREILIAIDLSRSMLAQDVKPSRLDRAKLLTQSLLEKLEGERVGLVSFSGTAFLQSPLSSDYEILREFLPALNPGFLPEGGTNYRALIDTAVAAFGSTAASDRFLIILSDGEATDDDWKGEVAALKKKGIRVIGLGVGTPAGAMIPDPDGGFVKDDRGAVVLSRLESGTLQQLARETGGTYRDASTWIDLAGVVSATIESGQKGKFLEKTTVRLVERFQWPLALGVWCLLVSFCYEFPVRPRPRDIAIRPKSAGENPRPESRNPKSKAAAAAALLFLSAFQSPPSAIAASPAAGPAAGPAAPLAKMVGRLSVQDSRSARDWAELARETITWGHGLQGESRPVPPGPVRDALAAVTLGAPLDPKTADWPKLRQELEALLVPPDSKKNDEQKNPPDQKDQQKDQKDQPNQNQDQPPQDQKDQKNQPQKQNSPPQNQPPSSKDPSQQPQQKDSPPNKPEKPEPGKNQESAFGDMKDRRPPPPPSPDTQKVGGAPEKKDGEPPPSDPQLALPLQKLDQLRNQDSPAELFQLMDTDKKSAPRKKGKDW
ncbi:MAG: von Willebrand factor type [Verrucomicrobia bacterium]|nr:von Willebrand factor type [Verrucomicrobiota bacterium]